MSLKKVLLNYFCYIIKFHQINNKRVYFVVNAELRHLLDLMLHAFRRNYMKFTLFTISHSENVLLFFLDYFQSYLQVIGKYLVKNVSSFRIVFNSSEKSLTRRKIVHKAAG